MNLKSLDQFTFEFYGDHFTVALASDRKLYVPDEEKRQRIVHFPREFAAVAWAAFGREILPDDMLAEMNSSLSLEQQGYLQLINVAAELRQRLSRHDTSLQAHDT